MSWTKDENTVTFMCDSCSEELRYAGQSFVTCSALMRGDGWLSLKRTGFEWTHHCPKCIPEAQREHEEYKRNAERREQMKVRNESRQ
jgi:hypothetical protein